MALTYKPGLSCMETLQNYSNGSGRFKWYRLNTKQYLFVLTSILRKPMMHRFHPITVYFRFSVLPTVTMMLLRRPIMSDKFEERTDSPWTISPGHFLLGQIPLETFPPDTLPPDRFHFGPSRLVSSWTYSPAGQFSPN